MKYIKKFENNNEPKIGQYVIRNCKLWTSSFDYKEYNNYINFINNNPGIIINKADNFGIIVCLVKYDNMPYEINDWLKKHGSRDSLFTIKDNYQKNTDRFSVNSGDYYISDDIDILINSKKYNL